MRVLVVATDHVGTRMASNGIRTYKLACEIAKQHSVQLAVPTAPDIAVAGLDVTVVRPDDGRRISALARTADAVFAQRLPATTAIQLARSDTTRTIYDLYASSLFERLVFEGAQTHSLQRRMRARTFDLLEEVALETGSGFVCAGERQQEFWRSHLERLGRTAPVALVPFGIEETPPRPAGHAVKGVVPGVGASDHVLIWGGGLWEWLDPLTPIRAVAQLARRRDDVRLYFLGVRHPNPDVDAGHMAERAVALAEELGVRDRSVFFHEGWTPYEERARYLLDASLGVSAHFDHLETRYAFRTRIVDYIWAGLPIVATRGDELGDMVGARGLGLTVGYEDVDGWAAAIESLLDDPGRRATAAARSAAVRDQLRWSRVAQPLLELLETADASPTRARRWVGRAAAHYALRGALAAVTKLPIGRVA